MNNNALMLKRLVNLLISKLLCSYSLMALNPYFISKMHHIENLKNSFCVKKNNYCMNLSYLNKIAELLLKFC